MATTTNGSATKLSENAVATTDLKPTNPNPFTANYDATTDGELFTAEEVSNKLGLGHHVAEWLEKLPVVEDDPLLAIAFHPAFDNLTMYRDETPDELRALVRQALMDNGATDQVPANNDGILFRFPTWPSMHQARDAMIITHPWAFYHPTRTAYVGPNGQWREHEQDPTIASHVITMFADGPVHQRFQHHAYEFFKR